jgi:hypothetical protein
MQEGENCRSSEEGGGLGGGGWGGGGYMELTSEKCRSNYPLIALLLPYFLPVCCIKKWFERATVFTSSTTCESILRCCVY